MVIWHKHVIGRHTGPGEVGSGDGGDDCEDENGIGDIDDNDGMNDGGYDGEGEVGIDDGDGDDNDGIDYGCVEKTLEPGDLHPRHLRKQEPHSVQGMIKNYEDNDDDKDQDKDKDKDDDKDQDKGKDKDYAFAVF